MRIGYGTNATKFRMDVWGYDDVGRDVAIGGLSVVARLGLCVAAQALRPTQGSPDFSSAM